MEHKVLEQAVSRTLMPVPSNRLLLYVALIGIPLFTVLGMAEAPAIVVGGVLVLALLFVALDAPSAAGSIRALRVELPETVRTSNGRHFEIEGVLASPGDGSPTVNVGLAFPRGLECEKSILALKPAGATPRRRLIWKMKALERGNFEMKQCYLEGTSRLGLWHGRRTVPCNLQVRVYPDLSRERNVLAPLFFRRGAVGLHQVRQIGKGREFEQLRAYAPGDGYEDIYWKGTARRRFPVTKMFQLERTQEVYVALDCSRRSSRKLDILSDEADTAGHPKTHLERFIQTALVLALAAEQQTDKFGLIIFSDHVQKIIPAAGGRKHYDVIRDVLYALQADIVSPDYEDVFIHIGNRMRHRALFIFLTDLGEPWLAESFIEGVSLISRRHVVLAHMLGQKEIQPMFVKNDEPATDEEVYGRLAGQMMWNDLQETSRLLKQRRVHLTSSLQENLVADVVSEYLRVKKRQLI